MRTTAGFISRGRFVQPKLRDKPSEEGTGGGPTSPKPRDCDRSFLAIGCKPNGVVSHDPAYIRLCRLRASECCKQMAHQPKLTQFEQVSGRTTGKVTKKQIKEDIKRVESIVGRSPTTRQYKRLGQYSKSVYTDHFGSWNEAKEAVGLEPNKGRGQISEEALIKDIKTVAEKMGRPPTTAEHIEHGQYSETAKRNRFGTHQNAIEAAGFDYDDVPKTGRANKQVSKQDIIDELQRVAEIEGAPPVSRSDNVRISSTTICRKFGTWSNALEEAGLDSRNGGAAKKVDFSDVVDTIIDIAVETDRPPFEDEVTDQLDHTHATTDIAGSWSETLKMAGFPPRRPGGLLGCNSAEHKWESVTQFAFEHDGAVR